MLHHVSLEVDPPDAERFIELLEVIGFARIDAPAVLGAAVNWFERDGTQVHLILTEAAHAPLLGHAAFIATPFGEILAELRRRGFTVEDARELWGEPRAFVLAPSGHRVELMAAPPA